MKLSIFKKQLSILLIILMSLQLAIAQSLADRIKSLPDVISVEKMENNPYFQEALVIMVKQLIDHQNPTKGSFPQRVFLSHLSFDKPVVFITEGYGGGYAANSKYVNELVPILNSNQLFAEHRYFGKSCPATIDWSTLTVENAAADHHHLVELFKQLYAGKWISTGISKGGETVLFHRLFYPNDVEVSVPYVAPLNFSSEDQRHQHFIRKEVSVRSDRKKVENFQKEILKRKSSILPLFEDICQEKKYSFRAPVSEIFDYSVLEFSFSFWQWGSPVKDIPSLTASDKELFDYWQKISSCDYFDIEKGKATFPFFVQASRQLGYYAYNPKPFNKVIDTKNCEGYVSKLFLEKEKNFQFENNRNVELDNFLKYKANKVMLIYGGNDPWVASSASPGKNKGVVKFVDKGGSHRTRLNTMTEKMRNEAIATLQDWLK